MRVRKASSIIGRTEVMSSSFQFKCNFFFLLAYTPADFSDTLWWKTWTRTFLIDGRSVSSSILRFVSAVKCICDLVWPTHQALPLLKALDCVLVKSSLNIVIGQLILKQLDIGFDEISGKFIDSGTDTLLSVSI